MSRLLQSIIDGEDTLHSQDPERGDLLYGVTLPLLIPVGQPARCLCQLVNASTSSASR